MADNRRDIDLIPAIAPEKDEVASYRRSGRSDVPKQSNFNGLLVFALVLMAIMMGVGGFTLYEVQKKLDQSNQLLEQGQKSIRDLDDRLAATGTDVSKTLQVMQAQQATNLAEIDKLWAVAYRQNRPRIQDLENAQKTLAAMDKKLDTQIGNQVSSLNKVTDRFDKLSTKILADSEEMATTVAMLRGQTQDQSVLLEAQRRSVLGLEKQMKSVEEAISVFDRYRQQTNQQLVDLQRQVPRPAGTP
jgi:chromosome segregation ATPase